MEHFLKPSNSLNEGRPKNYRYNGPLIGRHESIIIGNYQLEGIDILVFNMIRRGR